MPRSSLRGMIGLQEQESIMVKEDYESLKTGENIRKSLIALKQGLKQEQGKQASFISRFCFR